jgi:hypothetical protein
MQPQQFCQTSTSTGPVEYPGRQYDLTLPINPGFAVESLQVDATTHAAGVTWNVDDPDGEAFREELTTFMEGRLPAAATVTITNPNAGVPQVCGPAAPMQVHIECLRLDQTPPNLIELVYNGGQDLIQNPAYNESPALNPPVSQGNYGFRLLSRQDDPGPFPGNQPANDALCTSVANQGWETNDQGRTFEIWGRDIVIGSNVTPTPRGTPVQEITSDGPPPGGISTIWQTFTAPSSGNFIIRLVHGARDPGEIHRITLDNGDTDDAQNGDLIDDTTTPASVTSNGGPNPWTQFNQTIPLNGGSTYTLALSTTDPGPDNNARGGLFTDMRAYLDVPGERATAATDDETCVVTVEETTTNSICTFWQPSCDGGEITEWQRLDNGQTLTNAEFWAQVPTPECCQPEVQAAEGGGGSANLAVSDVVCATVGGIQQNAVRQVVLDPSGGQLSQLFLSTDGQSITPQTWTPGPCTTQRVLADTVLCDVDPGNGATVEFLRKYVQTWSPVAGTQITEVRDFALDGSGARYTPVGDVRDCSQAVPGVDRLTLCDVHADGSVTSFVRQVITRNGAQTGTLDTLPDGSAYTPTGLVTDCDIAADPIATTGLCLPDGTPLAIVVRRDNDTGAVVQDGWVNLRTGLFTAGLPPAGVLACGDSQSIQVSGTFCSVDTATGDVLALILIEYTYDAAGAIESVRLVNATTGATYTVPAGAEITVCPTGAEAPESDLTVLCDDNGPFLRDFRRDENGAIVAVTNYTLTGGPYTPTGTVRACSDRNVETMALCDVPLSLGLVTTFWRTWVYNADGTVASVIDRDQFGDPYTVSPGGLVTDCGGIDSEQQVLCDVSGGGVSTQFLRTEVRQANTILRRVDTQLDGISPYTPTGTVGLCSAGSDTEVFQLCDVVAGVPIPFLRRQTFRDGTLVGTTDTNMAGAPYTVTGTVAACTELDAETVTLCDAGNNYRPYIRRITYNATTGAQVGTGTVNVDGSAYTVVGPETVCDGRDSDIAILCDSATPTPNRFVRTYNKDTAGNVTGFTDRTLAGGAFTPTGAVGVCAQTVQSDTDFVEEVLCDSNGTSFIRLFRFNSTTGALISTTNTTLAGAAFTPVGAVGLCSDCCPQVLADDLCTNTGSGRASAIRNTAGTVTLIDSVTGATVAAANIVPCQSDDTVRTLTAQGRLVGDADAAWSPGADVVGTLTSVTLTVLSGTATVTDSNGTVMAGLPAGYSATWEVADDNQLTGPQSIDAVGGQTAVVWTQR